MISVPEFIFKDYQRDARDFTMVHPYLLVIMEYIRFNAWLLYNDHCVITSIYRNDGSTHDTKPPYIRSDIAIPYKAGVEGAEKIRTLTNIAFPYGKKLNGKDGETVIPLDHGTGPHLHVQISPKWVLEENKLESKLA